jgi:HK97 family phage major capsid protein
MSDIRKALSTAGDFKIDDPSGAGYLPKPLADEIVRYISEINYCRQMFRTIIMSKKTLDIPVLTSGRDTPGKGVYFVPTQVDVSGKTNQVGPRLHAVRLEAKKLMAYANVDNDDIEDAAVDVVDLLLESFGEAFAEAEELAMLSGNPGEAALDADSPRSMFKGLIRWANDATLIQDGTISETDGMIKGIEETISQAIKKLGKYGRNRKNLILFIDTTIAEELRRSRRIVLEKSNDSVVNQTAAVVEPGASNRIYGIDTYESSYLEYNIAAMKGTLGTGLLLPKDEALVGDRRKIKIVKKELEEHDKIRFVISERIDFTVRHQAYNGGVAGASEAVCAIHFNN